jgi:hypothetical protein
MTLCLCIKRHLNFVRARCQLTIPTLVLPHPPLTIHVVTFWCVRRHQHALDCADVLHDGQATGRSRFEQESSRVLAARAAAQPPDNR